VGVRLLERRQGANFTNILLRAAFSYKSGFHNFSLLKVFVCNFFDNRKLAKNLLRKLTQVVNFTNILGAAFLLIFFCQIITNPS